MIINILKKSYSKIFLIILISILIDYLYIIQINNPPAWDQGYHLSNAFKMHNILESNNFNIYEKINDILNITNSYRGPLTYFLTALFIKIFKNEYLYAYLSNQIFNVICILGIFNLGKLFKNETVGVWASVIFTFSKLILNQRSNYLIDLSLTSFITINLFFFTKWYFDDYKYSKFAILSGISLGLIFLTKPTGIIFFSFPFLLILIKLFQKRINNFLKFNEIILFIISFLIIIFPWFSKHWLTIITSIINAWNWGVNYQEGLEPHSIDSWFFYLYKFPSIFGILNFSIFSSVFLFEKICQKEFLKIKIKKLKKINFWFLIFILNFYLVISLMSTKDIRFVLPIYPLFCIYLSTYINSKKYIFFSVINKQFILIVSLSISILLTNDGLISNGLKKNLLNDWPHSDIVNEIKNENPNLISTLAILPDTREINTFNLEAEAAKQGEYVAVRQIVSNENTYKEDLKYFDWFLVKTGDQGIMSTQSKNLLNKYLLDNNSFLIHKEWELPDKSNLLLLRRKSISTYLSIKDCNYYLSNINIKQIKNGINLSITGNGRLINSSSILIDIIGNEFMKFTNLSLANGFFHNSFDDGKCYSLSQDIPIDFSKTNSSNLFLKARILDKGGNIIYLKNFSKQLIIDENLIDNDYIHMTNRISKVELLGSYLRKGEFKNLFDLVGIINQSDPKQIYLKDAEKIYTQRYKENKNLKDLYSILISQILQRKVSKADKTIDLILERDKNNGNSYLAKAIINVYLFDSKNARLAINKTNLIDKSDESDEYLNIVEGLTNLLEFKFLDAYKLLT